MSLRQKPKYLIDSVILIDHLAGITSATKWLIALTPGSAVVSPITRAEVLCGASKAGEEGIVYQLLENFPCLAIDSRIADLAAQFRRDKLLKLPDAFQAAFATHFGLRLATRNTKDFNTARYPFVLIPYKL